MSIKVKTLGVQPYDVTWQAMRDFTDQRQEDTADELWIVEHPAVFTQGLNGKPEHLLTSNQSHFQDDPVDDLPNKSNHDPAQPVSHLVLHKQTSIPIVQTDRGGQITYHGPGQLIIYVLLDLKRAKLGVRALVTLIEEAIIEYLADFDIPAFSRADAPGVYVKPPQSSLETPPSKIASLGLKIRKQRSYHGLALNIDMDLTPFKHINPCGLQGMSMTQLADFIPQNKRPGLVESGQRLCEILKTRLARHPLLKP